MVEAYVTDLCLKASMCEYGELEESLIRDKLVVGISSKKAQRKNVEDWSTNS